VSHRKYGRLFLLRKPFRFFVFASQTLQVFRLALRKKAQYVVVTKKIANSYNQHHNQEDYQQLQPRPQLGGLPIVTTKTTTRRIANNCNQHHNQEDCQQL